MKRELRRRVLAAILAGTMGVPLAACSEEEMRQEYENEKESVLEELDSKLDEKLQKETEEIIRRIIEENKKANVEEAKVTTTNNTESLTTETTATKEPASTYTTTEELTKDTTTITTTVTTPQTEKKDEVVFEEPKYIEGMTKQYRVENKYTISSNYKVTNGVESNGQTGVYLYSLVRNLYGTYTDELAQAVLECNPKSNGFFKEDSEVNLPSDAVYYDTKENDTIEGIAFATGVSEKEIRRLNKLEDTTNEIKEGTRLLIKVLKPHEITYITTTGERATVYGNTLITGMDLAPFGKTYTPGYAKGAFVKLEAEKNVNTYYFAEFKEDGECLITFIGQNFENIQYVNDVPMIKIRNLSEEMAYRASDKDNKNADKYKTGVTTTPFGSYEYYSKGADLYCTFDKTNMVEYGFEPVSFEKSKQKVLK